MELEKVIEKVTRVEIIDETGRAYTKWNTRIGMVSIQDDGRTLKLFLDHVNEPEE